MVASRCYCIRRSLLHRYPKRCPIVAYITLHLLSEPLSIVTSLHYVHLGFMQMPRLPVDVFLSCPVPDL
jgi:hypothetical protein